jgi:hypothetical protein
MTHEIANRACFQTKWSKSIVPDVDRFYQIPLEWRYIEVQRLSAKHPLLAALLRGIIHQTIRITTRTAKHINRISN